MSPETDVVAARWSSEEVGNEKKKSNRRRRSNYSLLAFDYRCSVLFSLPFVSNGIQSRAARTWPALGLAIAAEVVHTHTHTHTHSEVSTDETTRRCTWISFNYGRQRRNTTVQARGNGRHVLCGLRPSRKTPVHERHWLMIGRNAALSVDSSLTSS